jgi:hypothetical protein
MIERLLPPWIILVIGVIVVGVLDARWCTLIVLALIAGHFILTHCGHEGLFGGKYGGDRKDDQN